MRVDESVKVVISQHIDFGVGRLNRIALVSKDSRGEQQREEKDQQLHGRKYWWGLSGGKVYRIGGERGKL